MKADALELQRTAHLELVEKRRAQSDTVKATKGQSWGTAGRTDLTPSVIGCQRKTQVMAGSQMRTGPLDYAAFSSSQLLFHRGMRGKVNSHAPHFAGLIAIKLFTDLFRWYFNT